MTVEEAVAAVEAALKQRFTKVQGLVFRQSWQGESYQKMAHAFGYDAGYIKEIGSELWQRLSKAFGEKVTKHNFQEQVERFMQQQLATVAPAPELLPKTAQHQRVQNLPARDFSEIIGRDREMAKLLDFFSSRNSAHCISIEGSGGMGKTTLALAAVSQYLHSQSVQSSKFEAVIFTSAKLERLTPQGILPRLKPECSLQDIFRTIARAFNRQDILFMEFDEQLEQIQDCLNRQSTLLMIDNFETVEDGRLIVSFLYDLPSTVKVIITSRQQFSFPAIALEPLSTLESAALIQQQAHHKNISLSAAAVQTLCEQTSGVPAAIVYAVGQLGAGYTHKPSSTRSPLAIGDYAYFYFKTSMALLHGTLSHHLLMAWRCFRVLQRWRRSPA